jgi:hypothetical protein
MPGTNNGQTDAEMLALIREHHEPVPVGAVDWTALATRIVDSGSAELSARQRAAYMIGTHAGAHAPLRRPLPHPWWEVTAGWARPAIAAALVVCAISTAVVIASPIVTVADVGDTGTSAWLQTLDAAAGVTPAPAVNRDSLLSEVVSQ